MFGRKKKLEALNAEKEELAKKQQAEKAAQEHQALVDRYYKAREYDQRVAAGEDPDIVEREVYGAHDDLNESEEVKPVEETPVEEETEEETPVEEEAEEETPVEEETEEETPVEEEAEEETPVEEEAEEETPVEEEAEEETPVEEEAEEETPVEEEAEEETPVEEETEEETPVEEEAEEETPVEEEAEEETPVEEETVEEAPVEEETVDEAPVEEVKEEKKPASTKKATPKKAAPKKAAAKKAPAKAQTKEENPVEEVKEEKKPVSTKKATPKKAAAKKAEDEGEKVLVPASDDDTTGGKYEIFADADGYKYRLIASNGQIMANSEVYTTVKGAQKGIETLKTNLDTLVTHIETDKHRKSQFIGCTAQNKVLIHSANYSSKAAAESAIESVKGLAHATKIVLVEENGDSKPELVDRTKFLKEAGKGKFVVLFNQENLTYQFALKASNGQTIVTSKFYKSDVSCKGAITKFKNEVKTGTFYTVQDKNGQYQFRLYSSANKLVQSGISYSTKAKCLSNIESICRFIDSDLAD